MIFHRIRLARSCLRVNVMSQSAILRLGKSQESRLNDLAFATKGFTAESDAIPGKLVYHAKVLRDRSPSSTGL